MRNAKKEDAHQIGDVLLDFYNMEDQEEAKKVFFNELEKEFHYIVAIEKDGLLYYSNTGQLF